MVKNVSLTLRDAQHLCWKTYLKFQAKGENRSALLAVAADLEKKACEIAGKLRSLEASAADDVGKEEVGKLLSRLLYLAFVVAEYYGVSLEDAFMQAVDEYILERVS